MVLEIRISNFFSIKNEVVLDLRAGNLNTQKTKELNNNTFIFKEDKVLKSVAIYGANASGKSNIIKTIRFAISMILQSHNHNENAIFNFKPFKYGDSEKKPSSFFIRFVMNNIEYEYGFSLTNDRITKEELHFYPNNRITKIFTRNEEQGISKKEIYSFGPTIKRPFDIAENTSNKTLFISRASQMDRDIAKEIFHYFNEKFLLGYPVNPTQIESLFKKHKSKLLTALKIADSDIINISITSQIGKANTIEANMETLQASIYEHEVNNFNINSYHKAFPNIQFDFLTEESEGTKALFFMILTIIDVVENNKILLVDELGNSLHNKIAEYIINIFHISEQAQFIFTTHNTSLLNLNKFRKDQIYFINKSEIGSSDLYSLFDFKDFREKMDLEKAYLQGRFDAIPFVDDTIENINLILNGA